MSENKEKKPKARLYVKLAGGASLITGILCYVLKAVLPERIDESGVLHESFFLLPPRTFFTCAVWRYSSRTAYARFSRGKTKVKCERNRKTVLKADFRIFALYNVIFKYRGYYFIT